VRALDDESDDWLMLLLLDELGAPNSQLDFHKSSAARDRIADRPDTRRSSRLSHKQ
jgi:hypothetical protein